MAVINGNLIYFNRPINFFPLPGDATYLVNNVRRFIDRLSHRQLAKALAKRLDRPTRQ